MVDLPRDVTVEARARAGLGNVQVLEQQASGFGPERTVTRGVRGLPTLGDPSLLVLDLSVGMGSVKVNQ
jgi:hypothetical protein